MLFIFLFRYNSVMICDKAYLKKKKHISVPLRNLPLQYIFEIIVAWGYFLSSIFSGISKLKNMYVVITINFYESPIEIEIFDEIRLLRDYHTVKMTNYNSKKFVWYGTSTTVIHIFWY